MESVTQTVYHISDIHIRYNMKDDTREDIIYAFDRLLELIVKEDNPVLVVVTGDIYDVANRINPEELLTFHTCFGKLAECNKIKKVITIPGNHDYLLNPENNIVHASLISNKYNDKILHFNKNTSVVIDSTQFVVIADPKKPIIIEPEDSNFLIKTKVLLLHETIRGAVINNETNYIYGGDGKSVSDFADYHAVMLGDIHKQQFIERYTVAYAGSLIQRNFGEDLNHGTLRWELNGSSTTCKFIQLKLRRAYITRKAYKNKILDKIDNSLYENPKKIKFIHENCEKAFVDVCLKKLNEMYGKIDSVIDNSLSLIEKEALESTELTEQKEKMTNLTLRNVFNVNEIIQEYLLKTYPDDPKRKNIMLRERLLKIHNEMINKITLGVGKFKLISLAWKNVFCYGENNFINFSNLNGIASIIGKNGVGKSSIIGILCYVLYDKKFGAKDILNAYCESREYEVTCVFEISGDVYKVVRSNKKVDGFLIYKNNKKLNYKSKLDMKNAIKEIIGDPENVLRNNIAMQTHEMYLDKSQNIFRNELLGYLNLLEYSKIPDKIKEQTIPITRKIAELNKEIKDSKYTSVELENDLENEKQNLVSLENHKNDIFKQRDNIIKKYLEKNSTLHFCNNKCPSLETILQQIEELKGEMYIYKNTIIQKHDYEHSDKSPETLNEEIEKIERNILKLKESCNEINLRLNTARDNAANLKNIAYSKEFLSESEIIDCEELLNESYDNAVSQKSKYSAEKSNIEKEIYMLEKQKTKANKPKTSLSLDEIIKEIDEITKINDKKFKWNEKCACCIHNMGVINGNENKIRLENLNNDVEYWKNIELDNKISEYKILLNDVLLKLKEHSKIILVHDSKEYYNNLKIKKSIDELRTKKERIEQLENIEKQSLDKTKRMLNYVKNANFLLLKPKLETLVKCYNNHIDVEYNEINNIYNSLTAKSKESSVKILNLEKQIEQTKKQEILREQRYNLEEEISVYNEYKKLIDIQHGIPAIILQKYIPVLNQDVNIMLEKLVDYRIKIDENCYITDLNTGISAVQMSGSQKFIIDLILRICFINNHPYLPEFLIIDEGFGSLDNESLIEMCDFIEKINACVSLQFLIVISHIEELNQITKTRINIQRKDNVSSLCYAGE